MTPDPAAPDSLSAAPDSVSAAPDSVSAAPGSVGPGSRMVQTVLGPVTPESLGVTLSHEHLYLRNPSYVPPDEATLRARGDEPVTLANLGWVRWNWTSSRDNLELVDEDIAAAELSRFRHAGGGTIMDPTVAGIGRDPLALARASRRTGVTVVMGCGYYVGTSHPAELAALSVEEIAERIERDLVVGVPGTAIRAGFIGEIGCTWPMTVAEARVLDAAAMAQRRTGVALMVHVGRDRRSPFEILARLEACGTDLSRVVLAHLDRTVPDVAGLTELAASGAWLALDNFGLEPSRYPFPVKGIDTLSDAQRLDLVASCLDAGLGGQLLLSQDICTKHRLARYGGHGYDHMLTNLQPWMLQRGLAMDDISRLLVGNPARLLTPDR